ncbi:MAG: MATE family efflux transporter, partial [Chitinophagaceae bacterium]|nr:MATE family efflux transporter [Chitinophagaceae bacterium]
NMQSSGPSLQVELSGRQIIAIAFPIALSILVPQFNFIVNNIFLGGLGQRELAVAGITGVYYLIFAVLGQGLNNGLQALISRRAGENKLDDIGVLFAQGVRISLVLSVIGILLTWWLAPIILRATLSDSKSAEMAIEFLQIRVLGLPFLYLYQMRNALLVGINQSKFLIVGTATEAVINIILDYGLIYGHFGLPVMGFNGAAVASIISEIAGLLVIFLIITNNQIIRSLRLFQQIRYNPATTRLILQQSLPLMMQFAISIISWEFFYILIEHDGTAALAVSNTMRNLFGFFGCFTWAFAATTNSMVSNVIGQGLISEVMPLIRRIIFFSLGMSLIVFCLLNLFPTAFLSIYGQGPEFITAAIPVLRVVTVAMLFMSVGVVWMNAVTGTGNSTMNLITEGAAIVLYCVYTYLVLEVWNLPITVGWASEWLYWSTLLIPSYLYMRSGRWKNKKI